MGLKLIRRGRVWHIHGTVAGYRVRQSTGLGNRGQADAYRARIEAQILERHAHGHAATLTVAQAALTYLEAGGEGRFVAALLDHFGPDARLADIDTAAANRAADAIYPGAAASTVNRQVITPLSAILNMAADDGLIAPRRLRRRKTPAGRTRWLSPAEAEALLDAVDTRTRLIVAFLLGTGCRTGEALRLTRRDLHIDTREAWLQDTKTDAPRMVRFPARTQRHLAAYGLPDDGAVFRTPKGRPYVLRKNGGGQIAGAFNAARDAAGLGRDVTPHVLRHTWATWHYAQNRDVLLLMTRGGWTRPDMALMYAKLAPADLADQLFKRGWDFRDGTRFPQDAPQYTHNKLILL